MRCRRRHGRRWAASAWSGRLWPSEFQYRQSLRSLGAAGGANSLVFNHRSPAPANVLLVNSLFRAPAVYPPAPFRSRTPPAANPLTDAPDPPTGNFSVKIFRIRFHPFEERGLIDQPQVARVHVGLVYRPIGPERDQFRSVLNRPPEVREVTVLVVDRLNPGQGRAPEQDRARTKEGLDVVGHVSKPLPDLRGHSALAAEPWEGRFELGLLHTPHMPSHSWTKPNCSCPALARAAYLLRANQPRLTVRTTDERTSSS
jgi:hypothetical protein